MPNRLLVGITSFFRLPYTKLCLEHLSLCENVQFDCIIADNNSSQEVKDYLKEWNGKVLPNGSTFRVLFLEKNFGVAKALNKILYYRMPEQHFMKLDNDVIFPTKVLDSRITESLVNKNCLSEMLDFVENNENQRFKSIGVYFYDRDRATRAPIEFIKTTTGNTYEIENPNGPMLGACVLWHKDVMNRELKFDESFVYGYEDTQFSERSLKYGENAWARFLNPNCIHCDELNLPESSNILDIKAKSLRRELAVPCD